jgi:hypothetical protein
MSAWGQSLQFDDVPVTSAFPPIMAVEQRRPLEFKRVQYSPEKEFQRRRNASMVSRGVSKIFTALASSSVRSTVACSSNKLLASSSHFSWNQKHREIEARSQIACNFRHHARSITTHSGRRGRRRIS